MTFVRTPATPRKHFGSALSSLGPPFPPFGLPANLESFHFYASSAESVGRFWFRESSQVVIKGNFHSLVGTKAVGSSGNHSDFVVETLNGAIGDFSFGSKPI